MFRRYYPQYKQDTDTGWTFYPDNTPEAGPVWFATYAAASLYKAMMQVGDTKENTDEGIIPGTNTEA